MLKTIKTKKTMRLDELIKYVWDNDLKHCDFISNEGETVTFNRTGCFEIPIDFTIGEAPHINSDDTFTVTVEEPIDVNTELTDIQVLYLDLVSNKLNLTNYAHKWTIQEILDEYEEDFEVIQIYVMINGMRQLVWERDEDE